jgi:vacuolar-type H+-ATPase subunit E/Vma4
MSFNSKCNKDLNIRPEILKLVEKIAGNTLELIDTSNDLLNRTQMTQQLRERISKWDYMKLNSFCTTKEIVTKVAAQRIGECLPAVYIRDNNLKYTGSSKN